MTQPEVSTPCDAAGIELPPITLARVERALTDRGYAYVEDEEHAGVLRARFDDYRFQFMLTGEVPSTLQTRGRWSHGIDISRKGEMLKMCNEWNMNRVWPKVYVRRETEDRLGLYGEVAADFRIGAQDEQVDRAITCGLHTVIAFFHEVEERLGPDIDTLDD